MSAYKWEIEVEGYCRNGEGGKRQICVKVYGIIQISPSALEVNKNIKKTESWRMRTYLQEIRKATKIIKKTVECLK